MATLPLSRRLRELKDRFTWIGEEQDPITLEEAAVLAEREERLQRDGQQLDMSTDLSTSTRAPTPVEVQAAIVLAFRSEVEPMRMRWGDDAARQCERLAGIAAQVAGQLLGGVPVEVPGEVQSEEQAREAAEALIRDAEGNELPGFRAGDPATSRKAAVDAYPRTGSRRRKILDAAIRAGGRGITFPEADALPGVREAWKRISELVEGGWLEATERERKNPETGSDVTVYVATDASACRRARTRGTSSW